MRLSVAEAALAAEVDRIARAGDATVLRYLDELLTVEDVASWLRVEPGTVYRWVSAGRAPVYVKAGGLVRFRRRDVRAWLDERAVEPRGVPRRYRRRPESARPQAVAEVAS